MNRNDAFGGIQFQVEGHYRFSFSEGFSFYLASDFPLAVFQNRSGKTVEDGNRVIGGDSHRFVQAEVQNPGGKVPLVVEAGL